jgi:phage terminase large subunit-like protein
MGAICEHYQAITEGQIKRLLVEVPTGLSKSTISQVMFPPWEWGPKGLGYLRTISASYEVNNALRDNRKTRVIIESDWFQKLWPLKLTTDQNTKGYFESEKRGFRQCCAIGAMTGKRGDRVNWDDPISILNAKSTVEIARAIYIFSRVLPTRLNSQVDSSISIMMQRVAKNDVASAAREQGYECLMLPMEFELKRKCYTSIGFEDPRKEEGELLFPERFPRESVEQLKIALGSDGYASQMQQRPNPEGGGIIKSKWFGLYETLPEIQYREIYADTAMKTGQQHDYSVFQCWGKGKNGKIYLIEQIRGKWEAPDLKRKAIEFWIAMSSLDIKTHGPLRRMCVEDKASGTGLIQSIKEEGRIPIFPIKEEDKRTTESRNKIKEDSKQKRVSRDKYTRVYSITPILEAGMVYLLKDAPYLFDFLDECESFTADDTHPHDDQIDAMVYAINSMIAQSITPWWQKVTG